jgi:hypothetical protein
MIWSIVPEEVIFAAAEEAELPAINGRYLGRQVMLRPCGEGLGEITALLSTDPADFLDLRLQVGRRVPLR